MGNPWSKEQNNQLYTQKLLTAYQKHLPKKTHQQWLAEDNDRRLIIVRPSVIYGPKDPGNVYRMIKALKKGTFVLPDGGKGD